MCGARSAAPADSPMKRRRSLTSASLLATERLGAGPRYYRDSTMRYSMLRKSLLALSIAAFAALPLAASAQYNGQYNNGNGNGDTLLPSQSVITGTLEQAINSP